MQIHCATIGALGIKIKGAIESGICENLHTGEKFAHFEDVLGLKQVILHAGPIFGPFFGQKFKCFPPTSRNNNVGKKLPLSV